MCGISGWVDFRGHVGSHESVADLMNDLMGCRGPDAAGVWTAPGVALCHTRLAVIDLPGGRQPMAITDNGQIAAVLTYSGEVYNYRELRQRLTAHGVKFTTNSDTEVVVQAYLFWGESFVEHLVGMFAFAIWDPRSEELLLVRDRLGIKPLYYASTSHGLAFGSEMKAVLAHPEVKPVADAGSMQEMLALSKTPEKTVFKHIHELRPGYTLRLNRRGITRTCYWALSSHDHLDDQDSTIEKTRALIERSVTEQLKADVSVCSQLSGGLDSSTVTAFAAKQLRLHSEPPLRTYTVDFVGSEDIFEPNVVAETMDRPYAAEAATHAGTEHHEIFLSSSDLADPATRDAVLRAMDLPSGSGDLNTSVYLLFKAVREHSTVALSGESSDEIFGGYPWLFHPAGINSDVFPWLAFLKNENVLGAVMDQSLIGDLHLNEYRRDHYRSALSETPVLEGESAEESRMRALNYVHLTRFLQTMLDRKDRMSMAVGLEVRVPFCDHRLVDYVFNVPWQMKTFDGREKSLLRAAAGDVLPESIRSRRKVMYPTSQDPAYEAAIREEFRAVVGEPTSPVLPLLDPGAVKTILNAPSASVSLSVERAGMEFALQLNAWLKQYRVDLQL